MPATITHAYFVNDVYDKLPDNIKELIDLKRCKTFGQSTDSLMFYNLFTLAKGKDIRKFHKTFHDNNTKDFFLNLIRYIKDNNIKDTDTYSFLVGFICHFVLDSTIHPYIIYKSGKFKRTDPSTYKYNNQHAFMESFLDMDMIHRREGINPYKYNLNNNIFDLRVFSKDLDNTINNTFYKTFKINNMSKIYYKSLKQMRYSLNIFRRDSYGIKKGVYKFFDLITPRNTFRFEAISYHVPLEDKRNYLNDIHNIWRYPTNYDITSNESFIDLYVKSIDIAYNLICSSFDYFNDKDIELDKVFNNNSYITGVDCNLKEELKYFEF